ncbi:MAG: DUF4256 domain-containing protein [Ruminococcaceae bacterium]|nr:DUF4256 domain-containing protein [Oscillospiraceae bacterium]
MKNKLRAEDTEKLLTTLKTRFMDNTGRHSNLKWEDIENRLRANDEKLSVIYKMEETGGEPDVIGFDNDNNTYIFCDCSKETPDKRRSLCYDQKALDDRKKFKPEGSACGMATEMGAWLLDKDMYDKLQSLGELDLKTSSWIKTPDKIRKLGGALFCERRYGEVFVFHNGAESYYQARGFRVFVLV